MKLKLTDYAPVQAYCGTCLTVMRCHQLMLYFVDSDVYFVHSLTIMTLAVVLHAWPRGNTSALGLKLVLIEIKTRSGGGKGKHSPIPPFPKQILWE